MRREPTRQMTSKIDSKSAINLATSSRAIDRDHYSSQQSRIMFCMVLLATLTHQHCTDCSSYLISWMASDRQGTGGDPPSFVPRRRPSKIDCNRSAPVVVLCCDVSKSKCTKNCSELMLHRLMMVIAPQLILGISND